MKNRWMRWTIVSMMALSVPLLAATQTHRSHKAARPIAHKTAVTSTAQPAKTLSATKKVSHKAVKHRVTRHNVSTLAARKHVTKHRPLAHKASTVKKTSKAL